MEALRGLDPPQLVNGRDVPAYSIVHEEEIRPLLSAVAVAVALAAVAAVAILLSRPYPLTTPLLLPPLLLALGCVLRPPLLLCDETSSSPWRTRGHLLSDEEEELALVDPVSWQVLAPLRPGVLSAPRLGGRRQ